MLIQTSVSRNPLHHCTALTHHVVYCFYFLRLLKKCSANISTTDAVQFLSVITNSQTLWSVVQRHSSSALRHVVLIQSDDCQPVTVCFTEEQRKELTP